MAHVIIEWTDNLKGEFDLRSLMEMIADDACNNSGGTFPVGGVRVRGYRLSDYVIADNNGPDDAFINIEVKMGVGRTEEFRKTYFDALFARVVEHLGDLFERRPTALTLYVAEAEGWKKNSIHTRLKKS